MSDSRLQSQKVDTLSVKVGNQTGRQIKNLGPGIDPSDAVNLSQFQTTLNAAVDTLNTQIATINSMLTAISKIPSTGAVGAIPYVGPLDPSNQSSLTTDTNLKYNSATQTFAVPNITIATAIVNSSLTPSEVVFTDAGKKLISQPATTARDSAHLNAAVLGQTINGGNFTVSETPTACGGSQSVTINGASFTAPLGGGPCSGSASFTINGANFTFAFGPIAAVGTQTLI